MFYKCDLKIGESVHDATPYLKNWDDVECDFVRKNMGGIVRSFTSKFEFVGKAYDALLEELRSKGPMFTAGVTIYTRNEAWEWVPLFGCVLDASSIEYDGTTFSASAYETDLASKITANKNTKYEYEVSGLTTREMTFERLKMNNWEAYTLAPDDTDMNGRQVVTSHSGWTTLPIYHTDDRVNVSGAMEFRDQEGDVLVYDPFSTSIDTAVAPARNTADDAYFAIAKKKTTLSVRMFITLANPIGYLNDYKVKLGVYAFKADGTLLKTLGYSQAGRGDDSVTLNINTSVELEEGQYVSALIGHSYVYETHDKITSTIFYNEALNYKYDVNDWTARFDWEDTGQSVKIDCMRPLTLLNRILETITGGEAAGRIEDTGNERLTGCRLIAAESARGFEGAKVYTSFQDFCDFMEALFGYVYTIENGVVVFRHRDKLFSGNEPMEVKTFREFSVSADGGSFYAAVEVGHEPVDYEEENGRKEFNFRQTYATGVALVDARLTLNPKYRVDGYGLEYLVEKRADADTDDESDTDVFAVHTNGSATDLKPDRSIAIVRYKKMDIGEITIDTDENYINAKYHPIYCIHANRSYLATFADTLAYASSDGDVSLMFGTAKLNQDISVKDAKRYTPMTMTFTTDAIGIPEDLNGLVGLTHAGRMYSGWISSLRLTSVKEKAAQYKLILSPSVFGDGQWADGDQGGETAPGGTETAGKTIYVRAGFTEAGKMMFVASEAAPAAYRMRARISYVEEGAVKTGYFLFTMQPGQTQLESQEAYAEPTYIEFIVVRNEADKNTYVTSFVNREIEEGEDVSKVELTLSVALEYETGKKQTKVTGWLSAQAPEDLTITIPLRSVGGQTGSVTIHVPTGDTYASASVSGDYTSVTGAPSYGQHELTSITYTGYDYSMIDTPTTPEVTWQKPVITSVEVEDISHRGGTISTATAMYTQEGADGYVSGTAQVTFAAVTAQETSNTARTLIATRYVKVTANGVESDPYQVSIYQAAKVVVNNRLSVEATNRSGETLNIMTLVVSGRLLIRRPVEIAPGETAVVLDGYELGDVDQATIELEYDPFDRNCAVYAGNATIEADMEKGVVYADVYAITDNRTAMVTLIFD